MRRVHLPGTLPAHCRQCRAVSAGKLPGPPEELEGGDERARERDEGRGGGPAPRPDPTPLAPLPSDRAGNPIAVRTPGKGERARLVGLANRNAAEAHRMRKEKEADYERLSERLGSLCRLPKPPVRIEGFDISNIGGAEPSGSMVTFVAGKGVKKWYRKFAVRGTAGQDDFAVMGG